MSAVSGKPTPGQTSAPAPQRSIDAPFTSPTDPHQLNGGRTGGYIEPDGTQGTWDNPHWGSLDPLKLAIYPNEFYELNDGTDETAATPHNVPVRVVPKLDYEAILEPFAQLLTPRVKQGHADLLQGGAMVDADGRGRLNKMDHTGQSQTVLTFKPAPNPKEPFPNPRTFPYVVLSQAFLRTHKDVHQGDLVIVLYGGRVTYAVAGDAGDTYRIGEVSVKVAEDLQFQGNKLPPSNPNSGANPNNGGVGNGVTFIFCPGVGFGNPADPSQCTPQNIRKVGEAVFKAMGGRP